MSEAQSLLLTHWHSPGDIVCMTAAVRDLATTYPGRFRIFVGTASSELWSFNPHIAGVCKGEMPASTRIIRLDIKTPLEQANENPLHVLTAFHRELSRELGVPLSLRHPHGDLHLAKEEKGCRLIRDRYWYFVAGGKADISTKVWPPEHCQRLVELLTQNGINVVQGGANLPGHSHPVLKGVRSTVGKTSIRDVLRLIYHADGVICPVTFSMHVAAAFEKPCVVIAGGREPWWWEAYLNSKDRHFGQECSPVKVPHKFLHSQGRLHCCMTGGCWKTDLNLPLAGANDCLLPTTIRGALRPTCLTQISPEEVLSAVLSFNSNEPMKSA